MFALAIFLGFLLVPILEIYIIIQVGQVIGGWQTVVLLILESILGGWIVRREGRRAWRALAEALRMGEMPDKQLADAALILVGGALLLTPGFATDVVGFLFVLPFTRPLVRKALSAYVARRVRRRVRLAQERSGHGVPPRQEEGGGVIRGEVLPDEDEARD